MGKRKAYNSSRSDVLDFKSMTPPLRTGLEKGNTFISAFIPTRPGGALKGGGKKTKEIKKRRS